jgi:hypothetical protein
MNLDVAQKDIILQHLLEGNSISQAECTNKYDFIRLGGLIWYLRNEGFVIKDYNTRPKYSEYYIDKDSEYAIKDNKTARYLSDVYLSDQYFAWSIDLDGAINFRAAVFPIISYLRTKEKRSISVVEKNSP